MVRLSKQVLARQTKTEYHYPGDYERLGDLVEKYGPDSYLDIVYDYSDCTVRIGQTLQETDEEYEARIEAYRSALLAEAARKKAKKQKQEAEERAIYEQLKAKFG